MNLNRVMLGGNLTRDPDQRATPGGKSVVDFGLAINRKWKAEGGEDREEVTFVDCTAWGRTGEVIAEHLRKGDPIFIEGRLSFRQWEDKNGGGKRSKLSVTVDSFQFVGGRRDGDGQPATKAPPGNPPSVRDAQARARAGDKAGAAMDSAQDAPGVGFDEIPFARHHDW